jgi:Fe-S-cluster containining protein
MKIRSEPFSLPPVFQCRQCGECCHGQGGILPSPQEQELIAQYLKIPLAVLRRDYLEATPSGLAVKTRPEGGCIFLVGQRCRIHPVKPRICRDWPFLPALLLHEEEFTAAKTACAGLDPNGTHSDFLTFWQTKVM